MAYLLLLFFYIPDAINTLSAAGVEEFVRVSRYVTRTCGSQVKFPAVCFGLRCSAVTICLFFFFYFRLRGQCVLGTRAPASYHMEGHMQLRCVFDSPPPSPLAPTTAAH